MTIWEFACMQDGFHRSNGADDKPPAMDDERLGELGIEGF